MPPTARVISWWFLGAGWGVLNLGAWSALLVPIRKHWLDQEWIEEKKIWKGREVVKQRFAMGEEVYLPKAMIDTTIESPFIAKAVKLLVDSPEEEDEEPDYELIEAIQWVYGHAVVPWLSLELRHLLITGDKEVPRHVMFGFHGGGDTLIAGRREDERWTPVCGLIKQ